MSIKPNERPAYFANEKQHRSWIGGNSMDATIPYSTRLKWFLEFPVDRDGKPASDAAYRIIRYLFENRQKSHTPVRIADSMLLPPELVWCICRQLEFVDLVFQDPMHSGYYRYQLNSRYGELQAKVEVSLIDSRTSAAVT